MYKGNSGVKPIFVNDVGGWAKDIVALLWGDVKISDGGVEDLCKRVIAEVHFPCVIFAQFKCGLVAIDCNDSDKYEVDDPRIELYVKLQYRHDHNYKNKWVVPFSYVPQNPISFLAALENYRTASLRSHKTYVAWGRFIAVSLDRFHVSHAMHRLKIPGGCYVTCATGYEDHALDGVKPRERMPFNEYLGQQNRCLSVIDAKGFGDFTHRMIEALGIGIPLIRPKLENSTYNPLIAGIHYLDCGHQGEELEYCLNQICAPGIRERLIENGRRWFAENATSEGLRKLLDTFLHSNMRSDC